MKLTSLLPVTALALFSMLQAAGQSTFTRVTTGPVAEDSGNSNRGVWVDYDDDGDLDLFVANGWNSSGGPPQANYLYRNDGHGTFTKITAGPVVEDVEISPSGVWGDYNNDGHLDLFVVHLPQGDASQNRNSLYRNNGDGAFTKITDNPGVKDGGRHTSGAWADYDNDGHLDLLVADHNSPRLLYHNNGNANYWLKVKLVGTVSNRAAIGAKVRVQAPLGGTAQWQMREISVGSDYSGHNLLAHFGLRDSQKAEVVRIEWPSGIVQELRDVPANQTLTVTEPAKLEPKGPGQFAIRSWKGMAFEVQASSDLKNWQPLATVTNLTGVLEFIDTSTVQEACRFYRAVTK